MRRWMPVVLVAAVLGAAAQDALAQRHGRSFGHHRGFHSRAIVVAPLVLPRYYAAPYYPYAAPVYGAPVYATPGYGAPAYPPVASGYLYFCPDFRRYYPEVRHCPSGWLTVIAGGGGPPAGPPY